MSEDKTSGNHREMVADQPVIEIGVIIAGPFGFKAATLFEIPEEKREVVEEAPKVSFD